MNDKKHIVKRRGHEEHFDERKVYGSVYASCLNVHMSKKDAEAVSEDVCGTITDWVNDCEEVSSDHIFEKVIGLLKKHSADASFMYATHRDIS